MAVDNPSEGELKLMVVDRYSGFIYSCLLLPLDQYFQGLIQFASFGNRVWVRVQFRGFRFSRWKPVFESE